MFQTVFDNLVSLVICMAVGFVCEKKKMLSSEINNAFAELLLCVAVPCAILISMQQPYSVEVLREGAFLLGMSLGVFFLGLLYGWMSCKLMRTPETDRGVYQFGLIFPNTMYMGFPVLMAVYGKGSLFFASLLNVVFNLFMFTIGIKLITIGYKTGQRQSILKVLSSPIMLSTGLGMLMYVFSIRLPENVYRGFSMLGDLTTPLAMILIGSMLAKSQWKTTFASPSIYFMAFIRQILLPATVFYIFGTFVSNKMLLGVLVIFSAMPAGILTAVLAEKYKANTDLSSKFVFVSTVTSLITIPLICLLL